MLEREREIERERERILKKYLNFDNGFFIEVGAHNGIFQSNTYNLEKKLNWKGFLIEPSFNVYLECIKNRPNSLCFNLALTSQEYYKKKNFLRGNFDGSPMARVWEKKSGFSTFQNIKDFIKGKIKFTKKSNVTAVPLQLLIDFFQIKKVNFLSLDVEGYEYEVLTGLNFNLCSPEIILIEVRDIHKEKIFELLNKSNYIFCENLTKFNKIDNPMWDGTHQDYLFKKR
jgi:FkbM family methyltransferase